MKIYLVRHGAAVKRSSWTGWDGLRPLTARGEDQSRGILTSLAATPLRRIYSSPAVRCHETVARVAAARALLVELDSRLDDDGDVRDALAVLDEEPGAPLLICASRPVIVGLLRALEVGRDDPRAVRCQKGSIWAIERRGREVLHAEYFPPREIGGEARRTHRRAVLDIGSASMSVLVADVREQDQLVEPVLRARTGLRLGATTGEVDDVESARIAEEARKMQAEAESVGAEALIPVATAGLRDAPNGGAIAERIGEALETPVRLLSGAEEARFVYGALRRRLSIEGPMLASDLGGGSLDLAVGEEGEPSYEASERLGVTRLYAELVRRDPMTDDEAEAIRERVLTLLHRHRGALTQLQPRCVAAGGTVRALARLVQASHGRADVDSVRGLTISRSELGALAVRLRCASREERMKMPTVRERRVDLLPTGAIVLLTMLELLDLKELTICDWGLREGVLLEEAEARLVAAPEGGSE